MSRLIFQIYTRYANQQPVFNKGKPPVDTIIFGNHSGLFEGMQNQCATATEPRYL